MAGQVPRVGRDGAALRRTASAALVVGGLAVLLGAVAGIRLPSTTLFSSWAEVHGAVMGTVLGLLVATAGRTAAGERWLFPLGLVAGVVVGLNLNVSPWEGWWHAWYVLLPFALVVYVVCR